MAAKSKETVLVVGGAGYIGSVLVRKLLMYGYHVRVLDNLLYGHGASIAPLIEKRSFEFINGDLCNESSALKALRGSDHVVLLAALVGDPICKKYPEEAARVNDTGSMRFIELCDSANIERLVFMSTCSNYGLRTGDTPASEGDPLNPKSLYAETKVKIEEKLLDNRVGYSFAPIVLRCATAMGQSYRMRFDLTVSEFTRTLATGQELLVYDEKTWRPYFHVSDISEVIVGMIKAPKGKVGREVFNIGDDSGNYTKEMIVKEILSIYPKGIIRYHTGGNDPRNYRVSFKKVHDTFDCRMDYTVPDTIRYLADAIGAGLYEDAERRLHFYGNYRIPE